jgi:hypothetical protein
MNQPRKEFTHSAQGGFVRLYKNMQNKPNFTPPGLVFCATNLLTYCVTNLLSYSFMQNEPNSNRKSTTENRKSLQLFTRQMRTFAQKMQKMHAFCKSWNITHLTPYISKTYKTFHPDIRLKSGVYPLSLLREKMKNKPNFTAVIKSTIEIRKSPCVMCLESCVFSNHLCKTNPIRHKMNVNRVIPKTYVNIPVQLCWFAVCGFGIGGINYYLLFEEPQLKLTDW